MSGHSVGEKRQQAYARRVVQRTRPTNVPSYTEADEPSSAVAKMVI